MTKKITVVKRMSRGDHFQFGLIFIKKNNQTEIKKKENRNRFKPTSFSSVRFFRTKTGLTRFFRFQLGFFWFGYVFFPVWLGFFQFFSVQVWFGFFGFRLIKPKPNRSVFFTVRFFQFCFSSFLGLIGFSVFFLTPKNEIPYKNKLKQIY